MARIWGEKASKPAATGVCVVKTLPARVAASASLNGQLVFLHRRARPFEHREGGVSLVEVRGAWLDAHRFEETPAADSERHLLPKAHLRTVAIELAGDAAIDRIVDRDVAVEEVERHASDRRSPAAQPEGPPGSSTGTVSHSPDGARAGWIGSVTGSL